MLKWKRSSFRLTVDRPSAIGMFLFTNLAHLFNAATLGKLNKIKKLIMIKNLYLSNGYGAWRLLSEFSDKGWNLETWKYRQSA